jgi:hypothetical protein
MSAYLPYIAVYLGLSIITGLIVGRWFKNGGVA